MKRWLKKHELALWLIFVAASFTAMCYILGHPDIMWRLTNPIVKLMGGQN